MKLDKIDARLFASLPLICFGQMTLLSSLYGSYLRPAPSPPPSASMRARGLARRFRARAQVPTIVRLRATGTGTRASTRAQIGNED